MTIPTLMLADVLVPSVPLMAMISKRLPMVATPAEAKENLPSALLIILVQLLKALFAGLGLNHKYCMDFMLIGRECPNQRDCKTHNFEKYCIYVN